MDDAEQIKSFFGVVDYVVFSVMLLVSLLIGVMHAFRGNATTEDYLLASRSMHPLPVSMSLVATYFSAISLLGMSGEVFANGIQISTFMPGNAIGQTLAFAVSLTVLFPLRLTSVNEYVEMRFESHRLRKMVMFMYLVRNIVYMGVCLYAPTLALSAVTPLDTRTSILVVGITCAIYSTIGGIRAVVWTDVFQMVVILAGLFVLITFTFLKFEGFGEVWRIAQEGGRTQMFNMNFGLYERHTFWNSMILGVHIAFFIFGVCQTSLQRIFSLGTFRGVTIAMVLNMAFNVVVLSALYLSGLCAYAVYSECSPLSTKSIGVKDEILPYFAMDKMGFLYGLPGLFVAALFATALSSLSSVINSLAAVIWTDILAQSSLFKATGPGIHILINKIIAFAGGFVAIGMAFFAASMSGLIQASLTIGGVMGGPVLGIFILGFFFAPCTTVAAWCGLLVSWGTLSWIALSAYFFVPKPDPLPFSTAGCPWNGTVEWDIYKYQLGHFNETSTPTVHPVEDGVEGQSIWSMFYGISYTLYPFIGCIICIGTAVIVTVLTGPRKPKTVPAKLLHPLLVKALGEDAFSTDFGIQEEENSRATKSSVP